MSILEISNNNHALIYIHSRIEGDNYRGAHLSQHNRYTFDDVKKILLLLNKYSPHATLLKIRTTDISKRPKNTPDEFQYAAFCDEAKITCNIGTQDAMRKNIFVDLHRMGLINRFDKKSVSIAPFKKSSIAYVSISSLGLELINSTDVLKSYFVYSKSIDKLLGGVINILLDLFRDDEYKLQNLDLYEYMFFISAIELDNSYPFRISRTEALELIKSYRALSKTQRAAVIATLKTELDPDNYTGDKSDSRDFHNWLNEAQQVFSILNQTVYFENRVGKLFIRIGANSAFETETRLNRSLTEKHEYFKNHKVNKSLGFELHHVVPLAWSESIEHFKLLDQWINMVYIDAFNHAKITQNNNKNVKMTFHGADMKLCDFNGHEVYFANLTNVLYSTTNQTTMLDYNDKLIAAI